MTSLVEFTNYAGLALKKSNPGDPVVAVVAGLPESSIQDMYDYYITL